MFHSSSLKINKPGREGSVLKALVDLAEDPPLILSSLLVCDQHSEL